MSALAQQADALRYGTAYCDISSRTQVEMIGNDRAKVLHGLCTNDTKRLQPGQGCEAFLTNVQGKTLAHVNVFCHDESLVLESVAGCGEHLVNSIDRYIIREDAKVIDRACAWGQVLVSGDQSAALLAELSDFELPSELLASAAGKIGEIDAEARFVPFCAPQAFFLRCEADHTDRLIAALQAAGAIACSGEAVDAGRIEMGTPLFGQDITDENLPQEVNRDSRAISFTKGCYLGQETVARIDALGHVNRKLVGLAFASDQVPSIGSLIEQDGKRLATITSACYSARLKQPLALAYVKRGQERPGTKLKSSFGEAIVVELPVE